MFVAVKRRVRPPSHRHRPLLVRVLDCARVELRRRLMPLLALVLAAAFSWTLGVSK